MSVLALMLAQVAAVAPPQPPQPPADWTTLPDLPLTRSISIGDTLSEFVRDEVAAGRCAAPPRDSDGTVRLSVDMAVMVDAAGNARRIVPRAINCPTVEQYAVGLVASAVRGSIVPPGAATGWFKAYATFRWR